MRVAIVTDWMSHVGGGGRVLTHLHELYPDAPIYTSISNPASLPEPMREWDIRTSFLQRVPFARKRHQAFLPLMPLAFEQFDLREYDLVISTSSACAKGVITGRRRCTSATATPPAATSGTCTTSTRATSASSDRAGGALAARVGPALLRPRGPLRGDLPRGGGPHPAPLPAASRRWSIRRWTWSASLRPGPAEDFYLVVSRLVGYKRVDLAVEAATRRKAAARGGRGPGPEEAGGDRRPHGRVPGAPPRRGGGGALARCRGFLFPGWEDFGIARSRRRRPAGR
jgi:hypothetical protein